MSDLTLYKECHRRFEYKDGLLFCRERFGNGKRIGDVVGCDNGKGYLVVRFLYKAHLVHRLVYLMIHKLLPEEVDHIDGNPLNNKIENLRACTHQENSFNSKMSKNNTSGFKGVFWAKAIKKWRARITINGKAIYFGCFDDPEVAAQILRIERLNLHGKFANNGVGLCQTS